MVADFNVQALLDADPPANPPTHQQMLRAIGVAFSDALGPHGKQTELAQRWEHESDRGRRLQVSGHIDLTALERQVAEQVLNIMTGYATRRLLAEFPPELVAAFVQAIAIPGETFDDL